MVNSGYFMNVIDEYVDGRPSYSDELISYIKKYANLNKQSKILEIGAGPGTATDSFLDYNVDVLEISDKQVGYLKRKYEGCSNISVYKSRFEDFETDENYDLIFSAQAWHWVDQRIGFAKAANLLKEGGALRFFGI